VIDTGAAFAGVVRVAAKQDQNMSPMRGLDIALTFGISLVLGMLLGYWGGHALDSRLGTDPWFALLGLFLGIAVGFRILIHDVLRFARNSGRNNGK